MSGTEHSDFDRYLVQTVVFNEVAVERLRQLDKWGDQDHGDDRWLVILAEEFGEVARAIFEQDAPNMKEELIQVMAVCMAWLEKRHEFASIG